MTSGRLSNLVAGAIVVAVAATVTVANWRAARRSEVPGTSEPRFGTHGAPRTSREELARRTKEMERRLAEHPDDRGAALLLADALLRNTRVTGNPGLAVQAEQVLKRVLIDDPANYE